MAAFLWGGTFTNEKVLTHADHSGRTNHSPSVPHLNSLTTLQRMSLQDVYLPPSREIKFKIEYIHLFLKESQQYTYADILLGRQGISLFSRTVNKQL